MTMSTDNVTPIRPPSRDQAGQEAALRRIGSAPDPAAVAALKRLGELAGEVDGFFSSSTVGEPGTADELNRICDQLEPIWRQLRALAEREEARFNRADDAGLV